LAIDIGYCTVGVDQGCEHDLMTDPSPFLNEMRNYKFYDLVIICKTIFFRKYDNEMKFKVANQLGFVDTLSPFAIYTKYTLNNLNF
jgi:hypothetical protein